MKKGTWPIERLHDEQPHHDAKWCEGFERLAYRESAPENSGEVERGFYSTINSITTVCAGAPGCHGRANRAVIR
jgi:hypothetical protein